MRYGRVSIIVALALNAIELGPVGFKTCTPAQAQVAEAPKARRLAPGTVALLFTVTGSDRSALSGKVDVPGGQLLALEPGSGSSIRARGNEWSRPEPAAIPKKAKAKKAAQPQPATFVATLEAKAKATVKVSLGDAEFSVSLADLPFGPPKPFLDGKMLVERVPPSVQLTDSPRDEDFPAAAATPNGDVWCAYVSYDAGNPLVQQEVEQGKFDSLVPKENGDQIWLTRYRQDEWSGPVSVTPPGLDVWRPTIAVDRQGIVWVIWSQSAGGDWQLFARSFNSQSGEFGPIRQLTDQPGADIQAVAVAAGPERGIWIAWQAWRDGNFDILLAQLPADGPLQPERVSTSKANDWHPALVATSKGDLWIAWDTYDKGNYDVLLRSRATDGLQPPIREFDGSPLFEARPSLAVDPQDRLWVAFEQGDANWGKDYGDRFPGKQGIGFYDRRSVYVAYIVGGTRFEPVKQFSSEPVDTFFDDTRKQTVKRERISFPRLCSDSLGRIWLTYRCSPGISVNGERWATFTSCYTGDAEWTPAIMLPNSLNLLDNRAAIVPLQSGRVLATYSTDHRTVGSASATHNDIVAALFDMSGSEEAGTLIQSAQKLRRFSQKGVGERPRSRLPFAASTAVDPIHPNEAADVARMRAYRVEAGGKTYRLLRGEFHRHTEMSSHRDWDGPFEEIWRYGLDVADLDWIGPGDHDYAVGKDYMWWLTQKQIDIYHQPERLLPMFTYERSQPYPSGHRNIMFAKRGIRALPRLQGREPQFGTPEQGSADIKNLYAYLRHFGGICSSHTSATNMGTDWRDSDPAVEPVVEIYQGHRQSYEEANAPQAARTAEESIQGYEPAGFVWQAFAKGLRLGFQSSSDHVSTHISFGVVLAEEPTREGVVGAFKRRHCYAAQDNILLDVRSGEHIMGDEFDAKGPPKLDIVVHGTTPITRIDIVRQVGKEVPTYVYNTNPNQSEVRLSWTDSNAEPGNTYMYYVRVQQQNHALAWASPVWVRVQ